VDSRYRRYRRYTHIADRETSSLVNSKDI